MDRYTTAGERILFSRANAQVLSIISLAKQRYLEKDSTQAISSDYSVNAILYYSSVP